MIDKITLVLGGVNSGKSHYGEELALNYERRPVCLVTADKPTDNGKSHIRRHQRRRGDRFELREERQDLRPLLHKCAGRTVLIDSLTRHLANRLQRDSGKLNSEQLWENDRGYLNELLSIQREQKINLILLSDDLSCAPLALDSDRLTLQELLGNWNQYLAHLAHQVIRVTAGIPQLLKRQAAARFRLGAPSTVLPGDLWQNLLYLRRQVSDIQLLVTDQTVDGASLVQPLLRLKEGQDLTYSLHMPLDLPVFEAPQKALDDSLRLIEALAPLRPLTHTFHYDVPAAYVSGQDNQSLSETYSAFFAELRQRFPGLPLSLENTVTPLPDLDPVIDASAVGYAIDIGHLLQHGHGLGGVRERLSQAAVVHLHHSAPTEAAPERTVDHLPLPPFASYLSLLADYSGLVTIENYHPQHLEQSLETVRSYF